MKLFVNNIFNQYISQTNFKCNIEIPNFGYSILLSITDDNDNLISEKRFLSNDFSFDISNNKIICLDGDIYQNIKWKIFYQKINDKIYICEINL